MPKQEPGSLAHEIYLLRKFDGLTYKQIAARLNTTVGVVSGHCQRQGLTIPRPEPKPKPPPKKRKLKDAPKAHPLVRLLIAEMNRQEMTVTEMALRVGMAFATFSRWRHTSAPDLEIIEACFNVLGKTLYPVDMPVDKH